ncbi:MAG TPA: CO dehydrogenase/CO-methylating acetyl-CoA synthase complex subunit beta, partial [Spirochaetia bacterium]|nr:CO dehydrogenase/CO-methylating acetyl-CoA synthase complex subunit beta [Spirochaetia bacterium]
MVLNFEEIYEGAVEPGREPKPLLRDIYKGAVIATSYAEILLSQAIRKYGADHPIGYPDTAYFLPVIRCMSGEEVRKLGDLPPILNRMRGQLHEALILANAILAGEATWYAAEVIEAVRYLKHSAENPLHTAPWTGFIGDPVVRQYGTKMVDWTIPGEAVIVGRARTSKDAKKIVDSLMAKGLMLFLSDEIIEQLLEEKVKLGVDYIAYPLGNFTQVVHAANYALRAG